MGKVTADHHYGPSLVSDLLEGQKVEIYRNLHKNCYSVRQKGKVVAYLNYTDELMLKDVKFAVQPAGRAKVRRERKKNVHAFVRGIVIRAGGLHRDSILKKCWHPVRYDPYEMNSFEVTTSYKLIQNSEPIYEGENVVFRDGKVLV